MSIQDEIKQFLNGRTSKFLYNATEQNADEIKRVLYSGPYFNEDETIAIIESVLNSKWMSAGENVHKFEYLFSRKYNQKAAVMLNSGSSANLILITAMKKYFNWSDKDEIIVSPVGFPTTIAPIIQNNLVPVFVDVEFETLNFNIDEIENKISKKTKAIFISPVLGNSPDFDKIISLANEYNIIIILDSCDSLGSKWKNKYLNEYAFASSYSFYPAHHISTMEGGMITSNNEEFIALCRSFAWWGRDCYCVGAANLLPNGTCKRRFDKWLENTNCEIDHKYVFNNIGYNLKPLDLQGAIGIVQLNKVNEIDFFRKKHKKIIQKIFEEELGDLVYIPNELPDAETSWFGVPIIVKDEIFDGCAKITASENKKSLVNHLEKNGIQTRNYFAGNILLHNGYKYLDDYKKYTNSNRVLEEVFFVGCHPSYTVKTFSYIRKVLQEWKIKT